jgi:hypothetical protein
VDEILASGAARARTIAAQTILEVRERMGLLQSAGRLIH